MFGLNWNSSFRRKASRTRATKAHRAPPLALEVLEDYRVKIPPQSDDTLYRAELANTDPARSSAVYERYFVAPKREAG